MVEACGQCNNPELLAEEARWYDEIAQTTETRSSTVVNLAAHTTSAMRRIAEVTGINLEELESIPNSEKDSMLDRAIGFSKLNDDVSEVVIATKELAMGIVCPLDCGDVCPRREFLRNHKEVVRSLASPLISIFASEQLPYTEDSHE